MADLLRELTGEHREIRGLCAAPTHRRRGDGQGRAVLERLSERPVRHADVEEACLYPLLLRRPEEQRVAGRGRRAEHRAIAEPLEELSWRPAASAGFDHLAPVPASRVTTRLDQEEAAGFPAAAAAAARGDPAGLGGRARRLRSGLSAEPGAG